jgi:G3E family GTPase
MPKKMTLTTLVTGLRATEREAAISAAIQPEVCTAIILEGIASGAGTLDAWAAHDTVRLHRIAPGCMCCIGNLTLRVTLNRILRKPPQRLFIGLASTAHLMQLRAFLANTPYDKLLTLTDTMLAPPLVDVRH